MKVTYTTTFTLTEAHVPSPEEIEEGPYSPETWASEAIYRLLKEMELRALVGKIKALSQAENEAVQNYLLKVHDEDLKVIREFIKNGTFTIEEN